MEDVGEKVSILRVSIAADPGGEDFVELANLLAEDRASRAEAREICFRGITANPNALRGRLVLARLFYLDGLFEFAAREIAELTNSAQVPALEKLMDALSPHLRSPNPINPHSAARSAGGDDDDESEVLAEIDLDAEFVDAIDELNRK